MDTGQYLEAFLVETEENLDALNELCLKLEQNGADDDTFAAMFRAAHTLKGMSATMGFAKMANLTHHMEDALGYFREHPNQFHGEVVDVLFQAIDGLTNHLTAIRTAGDESQIDHGSTVSQLEQIQRQHSEAAQRTSPSSELSSYVMQMLRNCQEDGLNAGILRVQLDRACVMKGVRMVMIMRIIESFGDCIGTSPDAVELEEGNLEGPALFAVILRDASLEELRAEISEMMEVDEVTLTENLAAFTVSAESAEASPVKVQKYVQRKDSASAAEMVDGATGTIGASSTPKREQTLRVPIGRIDDFMNVLSELVIAKTRLELLAKAEGDPTLRDVSEQIARLSDALQDSVMQMRMMPVESVFQRFPRMMRDIQKTLNREFDFQMTGLNTEMDRTVMDEVVEALVHLLRNAADHGLESPDDREQAGKPRRGTIRLAAYASGGHVYLEVADDGAGIQRDKVLATAVERGIVDANKASGMSDAQVYDLLFASGFSTAATVSDISGRGVGLDAVRGKVESLGGSIRIESTPGEGSTFLIELPLTLTILQAMLVKVGEELFALPTNSVEEVILLSTADLEYVHEQPVYRYRGKVVPIVDLGEHFFSVSSKSADSVWQAVICREGKRYAAMLVDDVIDELEVVNKPLGKFLNQARYFSGATILGDGHVALILDIHQFFE